MTSEYSASTFRRQARAHEAVRDEEQAAYEPAAHAHAVRKPHLPVLEQVVEQYGVDDTPTGRAADDKAGRERAAAPEVMRDNAERREKEETDSEADPKALREEDLVVLIWLDE